jgi:predicted ArsR family transcriptional regulator
MTNFAVRMEPVARTTDPITSVMAADAAKAMALRHHKLIHEALKRHGPMGKDGIAMHLIGIDGVAVARRLTEMSRKGMIEETGGKVVSMSGRLEREWRAC